MLFTNNYKNYIIRVPLIFEIPCVSSQGSYALPKSDFNLPDMDLPYWLTNGNYRVQGILGSQDKELGCLKVALSLHSDWANNWNCQVQVLFTCTEQSLIIGKWKQKLHKVQSIINLTEGSQKVVMTMRKTRWHLSGYNDPIIFPLISAADSLQNIATSLHESEAFPVSPRSTRATRQHPFYSLCIFMLHFTCCGQTWCHLSDRHFS